MQLEKAQKALSQELESKKDEAPHKLIGKILRASSNTTWAAPSTSSFPSSPPAEDAVSEAESLIRRVLEELSSPALAGTSCPPSVLLERTKACLDVIDGATANFSLYNNDSSGEPHSN